MLATRKDILRRWNCIGIFMDKKFKYINTFPDGTYAIKDELLDSLEMDFKKIDNEIKQSDISRNS